MDPKKHTPKPWGHEDLLLDVDNYGFKRLIIKPGKMSSYHYHNAKNEIFYVAHGQATIRLKEGEKILNPGDWLYLPNNTVHQINSTGTEDLEILEFGHPQDDLDVIRVEDPW